jgi:hypothetical protein
MFPVGHTGSAAGIHVSPTVPPGLAPALERAGNEGLATWANGNLLVDHLHNLLAAAAPSLDGQHGVVKGAHQLTGRMGEAGGLDA